MAARVISTVLAMMNSIIVARWYGAEVMGIVAVLNSFLMLTTIFTVLGTNTSILRIIPEHLSKYSFTSAYKVYRKIQYFVVGVSLITGGLLFLGSGFVAELIFSKPHLRFYFALGAGFIIFKSLMILNTQAIRGLRLKRVFAIMTLLPSFVKLVILLFLTIFFFHQDNPVYALFASITFTAVFGAFIMDRLFKRKSNLNDTLQLVPIKEILIISMPMLMTATMAFAIGQTGIIMLGVFRPESEVGYYTIAVKLSTLTVFILSAVNSMAGPKFSELYYSGKMVELFYVAKKSAKLIFWATVPIFICLLFLGKPIISLLYGDDFLVAYWPMILLILGQFVNSISGTTGMFMNMTGNQKVYRNFVLIATLLNIGINILFTPVYGLYGAAIAGMVATITWNISTLIFVRYKFGLIIGYIPLPAFKKGRIVG